MAHDTLRTILDWLAVNRIFHYRSNSGAMSGEHGKTRFFKGLKKCGGIYILARSLEDVIKGMP